MDFKKTITLLAVICAFSSFGQELIAPYNMMRGNNVDVIDTVPVDEIWKVESYGHSNRNSTRCGFILNGESTQLLYYGYPEMKFPFWLNSGDVIEIPHKWNSTSNNSNAVRFISILRFKKPD